MAVQEGEPGNNITIAQLFKGKKGVLFAVPGAFTPGCSKVACTHITCRTIQYTSDAVVFGYKRFSRSLCLLAFSNTLTSAFIIKINGL